MNKILTFDCYGTLLNTAPLYDFVGKLAESNGLSAQKAINIFSSYEDRLMYGEDFINYDKLLFEILSYCDMEMNSDIFASQYDNVLSLHKEFQPFPDVLKELRTLKQNGYSLAVMSNSTNQIMDWHMEKL
ncbi:HAD family hydrolase, partial [Mailhella massiliensis]|uniref:HAD family hydrolase n=1 Tax=Mailhella massiliensis TaxID=1903261 RepID=UPI0023F37C01